MESIRYKINKNKYFLNKHVKNIKIRIPIHKEKIKNILKNSYHKAKPYKKTLTLIAVVILVAFFLKKYIYDFCYNYVFFYPTEKAYQSNITNITERASIENQYRTTSIQLVTTIGQIFGSIALLIGLYFAWGNLTIARDSHITERFTRAVDQLGNQAQEIRLGGVHALGRISRESNKDHLIIMMILTDYVRINSNVYNHSENNYPNHRSFSMDILANENATSRIFDGMVSSDIQAAISVIGERKSFFNGKNKHLNLKETFLRRANLSNLHLEGVFLSWANLERAILTRTHLDNAYLTGANLKSAFLFQAEFKDANLEKVDFSGAKLDFANLKGANLNKANFHEANLKFANLKEAHLERTNLEGANIVAAHLEGANLSYANLKKANLKLSHLEGAKLWKANFEGAYLYGVYFENASFGQINFKGADLSSASFKEIVFGYANFEDAILMHTKLEKANLIKCKLNGANLLGAYLEGAYLMDAEFIGAQLIGVDLKGANLEGANLEGADLRGARLGGADLRGAFLYRTDLENANLEGANLENADIRRACNLSIDQLSKVKSLRGTKIDEKHLVAFKDKYSELYSELMK